MRIAIHMFMLTFQSAFSVRLEPLGFDFFRLFAPDFLHEVELGVWKATLTHLIRILYACGADSLAIQTFNER